MKATILSAATIPDPAVAREEPADHPKWTDSPLLLRSERDDSQWGRLGENQKHRRTSTQKKGGKTRQLRSGHACPSEEKTELMRLASLYAVLVFPSPPPGGAP